MVKRWNLDLYIISIKLSGQKGKRNKPLINVRFPKGSVVLDRFDIKSFFEGCAVEAFLCRSCKKIVIDYGNAHEQFK